MGRGKKRRDINKAAPSKSQLMLAFPALQKLWQSYHPSIGWPSSDRKWSLLLIAGSLALPASASVPVRIFWKVTGGFTGESGTR